MNHEECTTTFSNLIDRRESLLHVEALSKGFKTPNGFKQVLQDVNLDIKNIYEKPQIVAIIGQSGSGKSTLLRILAGLDSPDTGKVSISNGGLGDSYRLSEVKSGQVGVVFQKYPLFDHLSVIDNLTIPAIANGEDKDNVFALAQNYLKIFKMSESANLFPSQLSGGMRQRVSILQQLIIRDRRYVLLDEPFSGLDAINLQTVISMLKDTAHSHTLNTYIVVTHDLNSAAVISDTMYILGRKIENRVKSQYSTITHTFDLIREGLAYRDNAETLPRFDELLNHIKHDILPNV
jgi:ABC-type nitrate/sulfonate/bicarbonate transport system ATPase subunit